MFERVLPCLGLDADMVEFGSISVYRGAIDQGKHHDSSHRSLVGSPAEVTELRQAPMYTMFTFLQDVSITDGPTHLWPGTHALRSDMATMRACTGHTFVKGDPHANSQTPSSSAAAPFSGVASNQSKSAWGIMPV